MSDSEDETVGFEPEYLDQEDDHTINLSKKKSGWSKTDLILLLAGVMIVVAVLATAVAIAMGAAAYQKKSSTSASSPAASTSVDVQVSDVDSTYCGYGKWTKILYFNMSDPSQECPKNWRGYTTPVRCCGRPVSTRSTCASTFFSAKGMQYSKVCGRAIGYQKGSPDGFGVQDNAEVHTTVDGYYVDGISLTHGNPRTHIWTFAVGLYSEENQRNINNCPCEGGRIQPSFVGNSFFCNSGIHEQHFQLHQFYEDPLWNGRRCINATCPFNSPPWFSVNLPSPTWDDIEVRICGDQSTGDEDTPLEFLELYVQ